MYQLLPLIFNKIAFISRSRVINLVDLFGNTYDVLS